MTLGPIHFAQPIMLALLIAIIPLLILFSRKSLSGLGKSSRIIALLVRIIACLLIVMSLARAEHRDVASAVSVIVINDVSRSIPTTVQPQVDSYIDRAQSGSREVEDKLGVITAARDPVVQSNPSRLVESIERQYIGDTEATNLAAAVNQALAAAPDDAATRIVLITDANETEGSVYRSAQQAKAAGIPIDVLPVEFEYAEEIMLESVQAPSSARVGETLALRVVLTSSVPSVGRLMVSQDGTPIDLDPAPDELGYYTELQQGRNVIRVPIKVTRPGPQLYSAVFEPIAALDDQGNALATRGDSLRENNTGSVITFVTSDGLVLIVAEDPKEAVRLEDTLALAEINTKRIRASEFPSNLADLAQYEAILLINQSAFSYSDTQQELMRQYVNDIGGGLVMIGGPDSFGAGGWIGSPLADALPIQLDPPQKRQMPMGALAIVLDSSGSMGSGIQGTNLSQMQVANEAAVAAVEALSRLDLVSVVAFSGSTEVVVPLTRAADKAGIARRIRSINAGGGTDMYPGISAGFNQIKDSNAGIKHVIVLSDGQTTGAPTTGQRLAREIAGHGATISTVAVGDGADHRLLRTIALGGKGRFYQVSSSAGLAQLPQIFIKEAQTIRRALIWEGTPFSPTRTGVPAETMRGISAVPPINGYIVASDREGLSLVTLRGKEEDPIAAQWQYGLGKVVTFTSDVSTRWASAWAGWDGFDQFWQQHIRWAMRPTGDSTLRIATENTGERTKVVVEAFDPQNKRMDFANFRARVATPDGVGEIVELRQVGPGRYEGEFDSGKPGSYVLSMQYRAPGSEGRVLEGSAQAAVIRPFADEYKALRTNLPLLRQVAAISGGRVLPSDPTLADLWTREGLTMPVTLTPIWQMLAIIGIGIFLLDVAVRRVRLDPRMFAALARRGAAKETARSEGAMSAMRTARERSSARTQTAQTKAESKAQASKRFEADESIPVESGAVPAAPLSTPNESKPKPQQAPKSEDEQTIDALSALRAAKKRARDDYSND